MKSSLNTVLKKLRKERGMSQEEIAKDLNISQRAYSYYETGERQPSIELIIDMAEYFQIPIDLLVGRYEKKSQ